jgi:sugar lactone lactonase YvrE
MKKQAGRRRMIAFSLALASFGLEAGSHAQTAAEEYTLVTLAGPVESPGALDGAGGGARFFFPSGVAVDGLGNLYVADSGNGTIRKIGPIGEATTLAGLAGNSGSADGTGSAARFRFACGVAVDVRGNVYVADSANHTIRKVSPTGKVTTLAGQAGWPGSGDGTGRAAWFCFPTGVAVDGAGNVYVGDEHNHTIRKINLNAEVTTLAGLAGSPGSAEGLGSAARFYFPSGVAVDQAGAVYVADSGNHCLRKISPSGEVSTLAGLPGTSGTADGTGSGARFHCPSGVAVDRAANVYVADAWNHTIRKVSPSGEVTTLAGLAGHFGSNDGPGGLCRFKQPRAVALDPEGVLYIADSGNHVLRKLLPSGEVITVAGLAGGMGSSDGTGNAAGFYCPSAVAADDLGNAYVADRGNHTIRKVTCEGVTTVLAGQAGSWGSADGLGSAARFYYPSGVAVDQAGDLYVTDQYNHTIRKVSPGGEVTTLAGLAGAWGNGDGVGSTARFYFPCGVVVDGAGNLYVEDTGNTSIRRISPNGEVTTLAGADNQGAGEGFRVSRARAVDCVGNVFVAGTWDHTLRKITPSGDETIVAGLVEASGTADGTDNAARFCYPLGVAVDKAGTVYVADTGNHNVRCSVPTCLDRAVIDSAAGLVGVARQLDTEPQTAASWHWSLIRRPSGSTAELSSATIRNPTFTPDVADLYVFRLRATNAAGAICIRTVELAATGPLLANPTLSNGVFSVQLPTAPRWSYTLEFKNSPSESNWTALPPVTGDGTVKALTDPTASVPQRFYRVRGDSDGESP